jgi:hypothetical protein
VDIRSEIMEMEFGDPNVKKQLVALYEQYLVEGINPKLKNQVDSLLEAIFKTPFSYVVPMSFIMSGIGRILFKIKLEVDDATVYGATEIAIIGNMSRSWVSKAFQTGVLEGEKVSGRFYAREETVLKFLTTLALKQQPEEKIKARIARMRQLKEEGATIEEMKQDMGFSKSMMSE